MSIARSRITAQGQISVPSQVRKKLGAGPGAVLEWDERNDEIVIRRAGKYSSADIHTAIFTGRAPEPKTTKELKAGIRRLMRKRHARR
jgi:AbrB family looped-hinge helix DNA binding protein